MRRVQLALNTSDLDTAVTFYTELLGTGPHKRRDGYANFVVDEPPLKLVLIEHSGAVAGSLNHLGIEVASTGDVVAATERLQDVGLATDTRRSELCCHAVQDKVWLTDPDGARWEIYTIIDDQPADLAALENDCATC